jgi:allantoin racemase
MAAAVREGPGPPREELSMNAHPPRIVILNPNTTAAFTTRLAAAARDVVAPGTTVIARSPARGPAAIECHADEAEAVPHLLALIREEEDQGATAYVIACFGDTGIDAAREIAAGPVVGMTEAALFAAAMLAARFSIITLPPRTLAQSERVLRHVGLAHRCHVRAIDADVQDCVGLDEPLLAAMLAESRTALREDRAEAIILGCAGLSDLVAPMRAALGVPVLEGVCIAVTMAEGLARAGLRTSKALTYAAPSMVRPR